jgi:DNA replication protein DnaC
MISMPGMIDEYYNSPTKKLNPDYAHMDILVIDEVGKELQKNTSFSILERVLLHRHNAGKKTILISNMSIDSMVTLYGATVKSRLNLFNSIVFPVIDFRRNNKTSLQINTINNNGKKD